MSTFAIDPFHPDVLLCQDCGCAVVNIGDLAQADELPADVLTCRQALRVWPEAARQLVAHDIAGAWRLRDEAEGLTGAQELPRTG